MKSRINVFAEGVRFPYQCLRKKDIPEILSKALKKLNLHNVEINVIVTDNEYIAKINSVYRKKNVPTDVISFPNRENPFPETKKKGEDLGEIYISLQKADIQAEEYEVTFRHEMTRILIHGLLHLLGYDHEISKHEAKRMTDREEELINEII